MSTPKFYNRDSSLTDYALSCGYIEQTYLTKGNYKDRVTLEKEHNCYNVRYFKNGLCDWAVYENLTDARKAFRNAGGKYNKVAHSQHELAQERLKWLSNNA